MASTYSDLKIELIGTGEQVGTWGATTNTNLGTALEEAITGSADVLFSSADITLTLTNTNGAQTARNLRLVCTGTSGGARQLILGSGCQIEKLYLVQNDLADAVTIKNTTGTGVAVPAGRSMWVFNNGTDVIEATNTLVNLATDVTGVLPVVNGGSGAATLTGVLKGNGINPFTASAVNLASEVTGTLPIANGGTGASNAGTARTNLGLGTISTQNSNAVSITGGSITGITDLAIADGGTGASTAANARTNLGLGSLATLSTINNDNWSGTDLAVVNGGTGASDAAGARTNLSVPSTTGSGASGTWAISISGNAATATSATSATSATTATSLSTASGSAPSYSARAWVNFNGTGSVAIRANGNISSITDNGVGDYTLNFNTALANTNYAVVSGLNPAYAPTSVFGIMNLHGSVVNDFSQLPTLKSTTQVRIVCGNSTAGGLVDVSTVQVAVFL